MSIKGDSVNRPSHYNRGGIECIDAIRAALGEEGFKAYCRGNALKYTWRAGLKLDEVEDLKKAAWYNRMAAGDDPRNKPVVVHDDVREDAITFTITEEEMEQIKGNGYISPTTTSEAVDDSILYVTKKKCRV